MSNRNNNAKSNSTSTKSNTSRKATTTAAVTSQPQQASAARQTPRGQTMTQSMTQTSAVAQVSTTTRRARKPVTIRVRATGEEIRRVPVERSGYRVVRYEGRYHTVRGGGRTAPYIVGSEDSEDVLGRA